MEYPLQMFSCGGMRHTILIAKTPVINFQFMTWVALAKACLLEGLLRLSATLLGCIVCVICILNSFHSFIFKLCLMIVHTFDKYFRIFMGVDL